MIRRVVWIFLLVSVLFVAGCVGGHPGLRGGIPGVQNEGTIILSVRHTGSIRDASPGTIRPMLVPIEATNVRIRVHNETRSILKDAEIPADGSPVNLEVRVPIGKYDIDVFTYTMDTRRPLALTGAVAENIVVDAGKYTNVSLEPLPFDYEIQAPEKVEGGDTYTVQVSFDTRGISFLRNTYLFHGQTPWVEDDLSPNGANEVFAMFDDSPTVRQATFEVSAPSEETETTVYIQVRTQVFEGTYYSKEMPTRQVYLFLPSLFAGEGLLEVTVTPPEGGIIIELK